MLSRVANSIHWMSRYIERAENVARFIDVNLHLMLDLPVGNQEQWEPLVNTTGDRAAFLERYGNATQENVIQFLTFDGDNPNSILSTLRAARENARTVRETISSEMWEQINKFYYFVRDAASGGEAMEAPHEFYAQVKLESHLFNGIADSTMTHGEGWHFARLGRLLERADKTSRILDVKYFILLPRVEDVGSPFDNIQWAAVLKSASGLEMYRKLYHRISPERVVEFLVLNLEFPRAIHYCIIKAQDSLHAITGSPAGTFQNDAERFLGRLRSYFDYIQIKEILADGLHEFLDGFQTRLNEAGDAISGTFFALRPVSGARR